MSKKKVISIVGGAYEEQCMRPSWHEVFGSAGRAASAIAAVGGRGLAELHCYVDDRTEEIVNARCALEGVHLSCKVVERTCRFQYHHGLEAPSVRAPKSTYAPLSVNSSNVVRFGMLEGTAIVSGDRVVYDPQNFESPEIFSKNGSVARELAVVLNYREASAMTQLNGHSPEKLAEAVLVQNNAQVVVMKCGPRGALVYDGKEFTTIPAFASNNVWKIGSGDVFVGHFAFRWLHEGKPAIDSAKLASQATAIYCETGGFPLVSSLESFVMPAVEASQRYLDGYKATVYLAGPFFTLAQLWLIEQARANLQSFNLNVFSPYHDVGHGSAEDVVERDLEGIRQCDILLAIGDGMDSGTIYEIGYARALGIPVIMYCENESVENKKMMEGSDCILCNDYVSAIYKTLWTVMAQ